MAHIQQDFDQFLMNDGELGIILDPKTETKLNEMTGGQIARVKPEEVEADKWVTLNAPHGLSADKLHLCFKTENARLAGAHLAVAAKGEVTLFGADLETAFGFDLRAYAFNRHLADAKPAPSLTYIGETSKNLARAARVAGVHMTRDLVNEPANVLTTTEFANRIEALTEHGIEVEILDEAALEKIGMRALLGVGQGSEAPSKVAIMHWRGAKGDPLALVGKGVVFDTGGISLKPAGGMEDMTMDMGGAATVVGTMLTLAMRKAAAHVIGIVGLVENMPDGRAQRPGDIVKTLKGDTVQIDNTDAEGRLVLADILWYIQDKYNPRAVIDLATLTGAIVVALGHENAGVFGNDDTFTNQFLAAAKAEGEGAWRMPLGANYAKLLKTKKADTNNIGGRWGGAITAAEFLQRFVKDDRPWIHLDIAGVCQPPKGTDFVASGASGWGVLALDRLVADEFE